MDRFNCTGRYVQGPGALERLGEYVADLGGKPLVIVDRTVMDFLGEQITAVLAGHVTSLIESFGGECSRTEIARLQQKAGDSVDTIVGIGGGKTIDTAKAVAYYLKVPVAVVPTIAATDAPTSALSVIYTEEGIFENTSSYPVTQIWSFRYCSHCCSAASLLG